MKNPWKKFSIENPQRENGHREINNDVFLALIRADLTGSEYKVALFIIDRTWGFGKQSDQISTSQFCGATRLSERTVQKAVKSLNKKRIIHYQPSENVRVHASAGVHAGSPLNEFLFNKHHDTWLDEGGTNLQGRTISHPSRVNYLAPTKESIKERKEKNKPPISPKPEKQPSPIPEWIDPCVWSAFVEMRKKIKKPLTDYATNLIVSKLKKLMSEGMKPCEVLNQSITNCWSGVFPIKPDFGKRTFSSTSEELSDRGANYVNFDSPEYRK